MLAQCSLPLRRTPPPPRGADLAPEGKESCRARPQGGPKKRGARFVKDAATLLDHHFEEQGRPNEREKWAHKVGWLVGWLGGWVGWLLACLVGWLVACLLACLVGWLVGWLVGGLVACLLGCSV